MSTLAKEFTEVSELLKKKLEARKNTTSTGEVTTAITRKTNTTPDPIPGP